MEKKYLSGTFIIELNMLTSKSTILMTGIDVNSDILSLPLECDDSLSCIKLGI